jgi:hypothetical protein
MAKETVQASAPAEQTASTTARQGTQPVKIDTSELKSSYCNVCNASSTREEVVLNFGINQNWDLGQRNLDVHLLHRIILSPFAAKRLQEMLNKLITEHEARYGELK